MEITRNQFILYLCLFAFTQLLLIYERPLAFILLGSAFILLAPFLVVERHGIKIFKKSLELSIAAAMLSIFIGGALWYYAPLFI